VCSLESKERGRGQDKEGGQKAENCRGEEEEKEVGIPLTTLE